MPHTHACQRCHEDYACSAPLERNTDGWPDPVCATRKESDPRYQQCTECADGRLPCDRCNLYRGTFDHHHGEVICEGCLTALAEEAHERKLEGYYGASTPQTIQEQYDAAVAERRELRKRD